MLSNYAFDKENTYEFPSWFRGYASGCLKRRKIESGYFAGTSI